MGTTRLEWVLPIALVVGTALVTAGAFAEWTNTLVEEAKEQDAFQDLDAQGRAVQVVVDRDLVPRGSGVNLGNSSSPWASLHLDGFLRYNGNLTFLADNRTTMVLTPAGELVVHTLRVEDLTATNASLPVVEGQPGSPCWDANGNGTFEPATEDFDGDGEGTPADCQGAQGPRGPAGHPGPNGIASGLQGPRGARGDRGEAGHSVVIDINDIKPGDVCPAGGRQLIIGLDDGHPGGAANNGRLENGEEDTRMPVCHGEPGRQGDEGDKGETGPVGFPALMRITDDAGACPRGGIRIISGVDDGAGAGTAGDGTLHEAEERASGLVCHGEKGDPGEDGTDGADGTDGHDALVDAKELGPGEAPEEDPSQTCPDGGHWLRMGVDDGAGGDGAVARDGVLHPSEVRKTALTCHGEGGADGHHAAVSHEPVSASCPAGGHTVAFGLDDGTGGGDAGDGALHDDEADVSFEICNGTMGARGPAFGEYWAYTVASPSGFITIDQGGGGGHGTGARQAAITLRGDDTPVIAHRHPGDGALLLTACQDRDCTSVITTSIDGAADAGGISVAIGPDGLPYVSYIDGDGTGSVKLIVCGDATCSTRAIRTLKGDIGTPSSAIGSTSLTFMSDGNAIVSFYAELGGDLYVATCNDALCSGPSHKRLLFDGDVGEANSIAVAWDGRPVIAYTAADGTGKKVGLLLCQDADCMGAAPDQKTVSMFSGPGGTVRTAIGSGGRPTVMYHSGDAQDVHVATCSNAVCASSVVGAAPVFASSSGVSDMIIGHDGLPAVLATRSGMLHFTKCHTASCSGTEFSSNRLTVDAAWDPALALGYDGLPVLTMHGSNGDLETQRLSNPYGAPYWHRRG